jgi:DivIVA domain-containing protein
MSLDRPSFTTSRFVETYDMAEVDDAVDRIFAALAVPEPTLGTADVQAMRFTPVRLREGYTMDEVDDWLDQVVAELTARHGAVPAEPVADSAPTRAAYAPTRSDAIVEMSGPSMRGPLILLAVLVVVAVLVYVSLA